MAHRNIADNLRSKTRDWLHNLKEKNKKGSSKNNTAPNRSYEPNPAFKGLATRVIEVPSFEGAHPSPSEIIGFAKEANNLPELKKEFKDSLNTIAKTFNKSFANVEECNEVSFQIQKILIENFFHTARALAVTVEARDPYTGGHSDRVCQISKELGKRCNLTPTEQMYLEGGALLHDVGKVGIRDSVLLKPGPLTDEEYKEMQLHPVIGAQIVKKLDCLHGCMDAVLLHHERMDGYGYPYGLKGKEIPLIARIASVADAYDAMTTNRVYRKAMSHEQALEEILRNSGSQFDPDVVNEFVKWWEDTIQNPAKVKDLYKNTHV